jgi:hypothetical protein
MTRDLDGFTLGLMLEFTELALELQGSGLDHYDQPLIEYTDCAYNTYKGAPGQSKYRAGDHAVRGYGRYPERRHSYRTRRDRRRPDGIASTARHSAIITNPMNPKAKASTAILPNKPLDLRERVDRFLICRTGGEVRPSMVDGRLRIAVNR